MEDFKCGSPSRSAAESFTSYDNDFKQILHYYFASIYLEAWRKFNSTSFIDLRRLERPCRDACSSA
jgi:hypothetical protein